MWTRFRSGLLIIALAVSLLVFSKITFFNGTVTVSVPNPDPVVPTFLIGLLDRDRILNYGSADPDP
jgi:hypothetical protein